MRNANERAEFIANQYNWQVIELSHYFRLLRIEYKDEYRYMTEIYVYESYYDHIEGKFVKKKRWKFDGYWKKNQKENALEHQSLTQMREWVFELDKKYPDKKERKKK